MYYYIQTEDKFQEALEYLHNYHNSFGDKKPKYGLDFETYTLIPGVEMPKPIPYYGWDKDLLHREVIGTNGLVMNLRADYEGHLATYQVGLDPLSGHDIQFIFDVRYLGEDLIRDNLKFIVEEGLVIGHTLKYEASFLIEQYDCFITNPRDLKIISKNLLAGQGIKKFALGDTYKKFLNYGFFYAETGKSFREYEDHKKRMQKSDWTSPELTKEQLQYAADDVRLPMFVWEEQRKKLVSMMKKHKQPGYKNTIILDCELVNEFALMENRGIPFNAQYHSEKVVDYLENKLEEALKDIGNYFTREIEVKEAIQMPNKKGEFKRKYLKWKETVPININSPPQILEALTTAGIKIEDTEAATLKKVRGEHPGIESILKAKKASHLVNSFGRKLIDSMHSDGKIHATFNVTGTETGRSSSNGPNIQQMPSRQLLFGEIKAAKLFRTSFYSGGDEYVWISCDLSQIEPCMIAQISNDPMLIKELSLPGDESDIHGLAAKLFLGLDHKPPRGTYERDYIGKTGDLQVFYKVGAKSLSEFMYEETIDYENPVRWTVEESKEKIDNFFGPGGFEDVKRRMNEIEDNVHDYLGSDTLKHCSKRKPGFEQWTSTSEYPRYRQWCITDRQESIIKKMNESSSRGEFMEDILHRWYKTWDEEKEKFTYWNDYSKFVNTVSREAWNFLFQGDCATMFKLAVKNISEDLRKLPGFNYKREGIVAVVHDEANLIVKREHAEAVKEIVRKHMIGAGELFITVVPIKVTLSEGSCWSEAK